MCIYDNIVCVLFRMRDVSGKTCRENQNTHFMFHNVFLENRAVYEIMWKKFVEPDRPRVKTRRIRIAFLIPKATNTHSVYLIHIALRRQQWLLERASMLTFIRNSG
jgi:hypothetical protein